MIKILGFHPAGKWEKIIQCSPLWIIFKGKIKIDNLLPEWSACREDHFFANLTTFEWRSGLKKSSLLKIAILRMEKNFSPERRSKVVKFAKIDRLDALIVLVRNEQFYFSLEIDSKGGPLDDFFPVSWWVKPYYFVTFYLVIAVSPHYIIIPPSVIDIFVYSDTLGPLSSITSAI